MGNILLQIFVLAPIRFVFERIFGWRIVGDFAADKFIGVFAPHTSRWDFVLMWYGAVVTKRFPNWLGKQELFENQIMGKLYRRFGGIPVDRDNPMTALKQMIRSVKQMDRLTLLINPEGTRQYSDHWKKGFYFVAHKTKTPLILMSLDYSKKTITISDPFYASGDIDEDMDIIRDFYDGVIGANPERTAPITLVPN